ncbi:hypothetical protein AB3S75_007506 [Citrus x aurantiifolia]
MEFVGRKVKKEFRGFGVFTGTIQSYDESSKFYEIAYEDGDLEEVDVSEVASLLESDRGGKVGEVEAEPVHVKPRLGRKPKKRRRLEGKRGESGKAERTVKNFDLNDDGLVDLNVGFVENFREIDGFSGKFDLNGDCKETLGKDVRENGGSVNGNLIVDVEIKNGIDLNAGFNLNLNDGGNLEANLSSEKKERRCIDLNLDANGELEENSEILETQKKECGFDLNVGVDEDNKDDRTGDCKAQVKKVLASLHTVGEGVVMNGALTEVHVAQDVCLGLVDGMPKEDSLLVGDFGGHDKSNEVQLKEDFATPASTVIDGCQGDIGRSHKKLSGRRKKRKSVDDINSVTKPVLRRSTRRGSARYKDLSSKMSCEVNDAMADVSMEELPATLDAGRIEEPVVNPPKLLLPPSSRNLDLDGIPVLDLFSNYACLRSFSTLLFLSPFELEDFVAALKCSSPNLLFDSVHVSILRILRKHLEHLSKEGCESASDCLRSLNWGLLDLITWPIFMAEYFLIHNSGLKPGFELTRLKLFSSEYCKQPVSVKIEILRCLCDDMIEVEAIRMELNRRSSVAEPEMDFDRNINNEIGKRRRVAMDISAGSCLTEEVVDDANDWNSDECCLCKMDGSLLCCDGCPAAYHSKCVGVANVPEGDWFCPECALDRHKPWMKPRKSLRGAELLGVDPHGRLYFCSCGYLLVSDSCDTELILNYYCRDDLNFVIDVLKSSDTFYGGIINAICKQWDITVSSNGVRSNLALNTVSLSRHMKAEVPTISEIDNEQKLEENFLAGYSNRPDNALSKSVNLLDSVTAMELPNISSEGSAETTQMNSGFDNFQKEGPDNSIRAAEFSNQSEIAGKLPAPGHNSMTSSTSDIKQKFASSGCNSSPTNSRKGDTLQLQPEIAYMNRYSFAQTASSVAEELMHKSSNEISKEPINSNEEIISKQMKAILKKWDKFYWPNTQKLNADTQKEKCGWCFSCKSATDDMDCLFYMNNGRVLGSSESEVAGLLSKRNKKGHLVDIICHILSIEDRLLGLLLGPWLNPHYTKLWRKSALKAADMASVKHLLLTLEANLQHLALSAEWFKHVDSVVTVGSASHIVIASSRANSKVGAGRKKARDFDGNPSTKAAGGLSLCWWRGGRLSCQLFSWKRLPRSLVSKAARQAGCMKIPGILYPENSDFARRSRNVAWRAAVESSTSVEQLAIQVREFDSNVRWDDIENTHPLCTMDKEFRKSVRLFKKAIIRRKCLKEEGVKYLVDFGKRRSVPDIVIRHGSMAEESSSGRKKYWLNESYVPLHLLKSFEERRVARKSPKLSSGKLSEPFRVIKKSLRDRGFSYLFSKATRSEYYQCRHCSKDVLIRDAVCCQDCKGYFHKRHIRKSAGAVTTECKYTCYQCQDGRFKKDTRTAKNGTKKGKMNTRSVKVKSQKSKKTTGRRSVQSKNSKKTVVGGRSLRSRNDKKVAAIPLRRSARRAKLVSVQNRKHAGRKRGRPKSKKKTSRKPKKTTSLQKKRTQSYYSYWLNGLFLSRKPDDNRVMQFTRKNFLAASELLTDTLDQPKCYLCHEAEHTSTSNYIACEICGEWYHGDAFGLKVDNISKLIGFRCHVCRKRTPVCSCMVSMGSDGSQLEAQTNYKIGWSEELSKPVVPFGELKSNPMDNSNEDHQESFPVDDCFREEEQMCGVMLESRVEAEKEHALVRNDKNTDSIHVSDEDILTTSNENVMLEDNAVGPGRDVSVALHDQAERPSCKFDVDSMETDTALLSHRKEKDGLVKAMV